MTRRPRLALPFTVLAEPGVVRLVAGEDFRFTLRAAALDAWLPALLRRCDGRCSLDDLLASLPEPQRTPARSLFERLYGERVLVDGPTSAAHRAVTCQLVVEGTGPLVERLAGSVVRDEPDPRPVLHVFCQDRLDLAAALHVNRRMRSGGARWVWVSTGPLTRGYVSPVFLPHVGPCLGCLLRHFRMLSPAPEIHDALSHGVAVEPVAFPDGGLAVLEGLVRWKARLLAEPEPTAALYRLHVLEVDSLEVASHRVFVDPECPECGGP